MEVNVEDIVRTQVAKKILDSMPEEEIKKIMQASLEHTLKEALRPWAVEKAMHDDVERYMIEYIKQPDVQEKIKIATREATDKLIAGVISVIVEKSQSGIKSEYSKFIQSPIKV